MSEREDHGPIPRLRTDRLLLRQLRKSDFDGYAANQADPLAMATFEGPSDRRKAWRSFCAVTGAWLINGGGWWAVEHVETSSVVGTVGAFFREKDPDQLEVGWVVYRAFWRNGYASEAARAAIAFGFDHHRVSRIIAYINPSNEASKGVARRSGMHFAGDASFYGEPTSLFAIERGG